MIENDLSHNNISYIVSNAKDVSKCLWRLIFSGMVGKGGEEDSGLKCMQCLLCYALASHAYSNK